MTTKNGVTFRWLAGLMATLMTLTGGWFIATQVQAGAKRGDRIVTNSVDVSALQEQYANLCKQITDYQCRQEKWNIRIEKKLDAVLEQP